MKNKTFTGLSVTVTTGTQKSALLLVLLASLLVACGKTERAQTTKERLGSVQELQETQSDFYLPRKSVDYLADIKSLKDTQRTPENAPGKTAVEQPKVAVAPAAPVGPAPAPIVATPVVTPPPAPLPATPQPQTTTPQPATPAPKVDEAPKEVVRTPPTLLAGQTCIRQDYPATSRRLEESGNVTLRLLIDAAGNLANTEITSSSGYARLDDAARNVYRLCKFKPGTVDGRPEPSSTSVRVAWKL